LVNGQNQIPYPSLIIAHPSLLLLRAAGWCVLLLVGEVKKDPIYQYLDPS